MAQDELLSQEEIDALLSGPGDGAAAAAPSAGPRIRPYDPASQHRVIRERLHGLDLINQRFARRFRVALFNLIRRSADITVENMRYQSYRDFVRNVPVPTNLNLISIKPLRGTALVMFPPNLIYLVVDNLFGGDGRFVTKSEGREFTNTEQRIIRRLLDLALDAYQQCWRAIHDVQIEYVRSEMQAKFANITNSPNEIIVNTTFHIDVGSLSSEFQICIPFTMIEPLRDLLTNPASGTHEGNDVAWSRHMAGQLRESSVQMVAEFVSIPSRIRQVRALRIGDVLPIDLPRAITARVDGVPVLTCQYGSHKGQRALRVLELINHPADDADAGDAFVQEPVPTTQESDHE
jgi:flagellar motor switch protein FliM